MNDARETAFSTRLPRPRRWLTWLLCAVILLAGLISGYALAVVFPPDFGPKGPLSFEDRRDRLAERIDEAVDLSAAQHEQVRQIVEERLKAVQEIQQVVRPKMGQQARALNEQVRAVLRPEQMPDWDAFFNERFARFTRSAKEPAGEDEDAAEAADP
ncbi:MAG: hypothetical protein GVY16_07835 [Planctomycetes bacterium]|jgi:hypothetical protein|nr:hypothetical protein [Phycisphaerae bacterium]NBB95637.1 hypothetical protein [Planctomycetota bacterium]